MPRRLVLVASATFVALAVAGLLFGYKDAPGRHLRYLVQNMQCIEQPAEGGVAAIGDSITAGSGDPDWGFLPNNSWLSYAVCDDAVPYTYNAGIPNQTTQEIAARLPGVLARKPAVVVILAGTNDVYRGDFSPEAVGRIAGMVADVRAAGAAPVLGTLPPIDAKTVEVDRFNGLLRGLATTANVPLIDFHAVLVDTDGAGYAAGLDRDGVHPSAAGARLMGAQALAVLRELVS